MSDAPPSQIKGQLNSLKGQVYEAIANVSSDPTWASEGRIIREAGEQELEEAREQAKSEASSERMWGKAESALGMATGDQDQMEKGNITAEKAEWKGAIAEGGLPSMSIERMKGKVESAIGMATGDVSKQTSGNLKAEKAEWLQG